MLNRKPGKIVSNKGKARNEDVKVSAEHDTYNKMEQFKKQLDALQATKPEEIAKLRERLEQAEFDKRRLENLVFESQRVNKDMQTQNSEIQSKVVL